MRGHRVLRVFKVLVIVAVAATVLGFVVMTLWNRLLPGIFGFHPITFWQALGLLLLSKILFGGFHGRPGCGSRWRPRMLDRWEHMTPEEREKFKAGMAGRCGPFGFKRPEPPATNSKE